MARSKSRQEAIDKANAEAKARISGSTGTGCTGWWNIREGYRRDAAEVIAAWKAAGLNPDADLPVIPDVAKAFTRAVRGCAVAAGGFDCRLEDLDEDGNGTRRVSVMHVLKNGHAEGREIGKVALPAQGRPYVEIADTHGIAQRIVDTTDPRVGLYTGEDIRSGIVTIIDRNYGSPCRDGGVVYWLPAAAVDVMKNVDIALRAIEAGSFGGLDGQAGVVTAVAAANTGVETMLNELVSQVHEWKTSPPARFKTVEDRMGQLAALKERADLLRAMLGAGVNAVDTQLSTLSQEFLVVMGMVNASATA